MKIGTYLTLWHGRKSPDENLNEWGSTGPTFGPFEGVTVTYATHVKAAQGGKTLWLNFTGDLIEFDGVYYGDFTIFAGVEDDKGYVMNPNTKGSAVKATSVYHVPEKYLH